MHRESQVFAKRDTVLRGVRDEATSFEPHVSSVDPPASTFGAAVSQCLYKFILTFDLEPIVVNFSRDGTYTIER